MHIPTSSQLLKAANIREQIESLEAEISALLSGTSAPVKSPKTTARKKRRKMSAEARERIAAAQRKRWAKTKAVAKKATPKKAARKSASKKA